MSVSTPVLAIILPCYNEEEVLPDSLRQITVLLQQMIETKQVAQESFALFVDDGSTDKTWKIIEAEHVRNAGIIKGLKLGGNAGHQNAIMAGMLEVRDQVDCAITMDADLQDDINLIPQMVEKFKEGFHIVYGVRNDRTTDSWLKRNSAGMFYKFMNMLGANSIYGHADFRLVSKLALCYLDEYKESTLFLRTIFPGMHLTSINLYYARLPRKAGTTKFSLSKMLSFAISGITMNSPVPLRFSGLLGIITLLLAVLQSIHVLVAYYNGDVVRGWTSLTLIVLYIGSIQLFSLAIIGEYLAKIFIEVKHRPRYIIEKKLE